MVRFSDRLKLLRKNKKLTQKQLAELLEVTERHYRLCEAREVDAPLSKLIKLQNFYNVTFDYLIGYSDDNTPPNYGSAIK